MRRRRTRSRVFAALLVSAVASIHGAGCGYRPIFTSASLDPSGPFAVIGGPARVPSATAIAAAEAGARSELARAGQLASCSPRSSQAGEGCAAMIVEVLRIEETGEGIALEEARPGSPEHPLARGVRVTITGRARIRAAGAEDFLRDTGDVRAAEVISRGSGDAARFQIDRDEAVRLASRRLGERLARRLLGVPDPSDE